MTKNEEIKARLAALKARASGATNAVTKTEESSSKELAVQEKPSTVVATATVEKKPEVKPSVVNHDVDPQYANFKMKLGELEDKLNEQVPGFAFLLKEIHQSLSNDPNVVTIMSEDEIGIVVAGLSRHMDVTITPAKSGSGRSKSGRTQPISADDL